MLKQLVNELSFNLVLETKGPFLIKDGRYNELKEKGRLPDRAADSLFVCLNNDVDLINAVERTDYGSLRFYIPGTSLRGVIRSHAEKILRTIAPDFVCDPLSNSSCSRKFEKAIGPERYKKSCRICKLFGDTVTASRILINDSTIVKNGGAPKERVGIAIDRFTGAVSMGQLFKNQYIENYTFKSEIKIRNFELWQLGLLAYVFRDFNAFSNDDEPGIVQIGFGKSKGFGLVKARIENECLTYWGKKANSDLTDVGDVVSDPNYGFIKAGLTYEKLKKWFGDEMKIEEIIKPRQLTTESISFTKEYTVTDQLKFWQICAKVWNESLPKLAK